MSFRREEFMGALSAMFVSLPGNIAFGMIAFAPMGDGYIPMAIIAAMYSSIIIGIVSGFWGGVPGLISGPQATTAILFAALLAKLDVSLTNSIKDIGVAELLTCAFFTVFIAGLLQTMFGTLRVGNLIKFIPYPVTAGILSGAIILIMNGQIWVLAGLEKYPSILDLFRHADQILWPNVLVCVWTMVVMFSAPRFTRRMPSAIIALILGSLFYYGLYYIGFKHRLGGLLGSITITLPKPEYLPRFFKLATDGHLAAVLTSILATALSIAILNTIHCLLSIVALRSHLDSEPRINKEVFAQGIGNTISALFGGLPGSGFIGRTLVNYDSGGKTGTSTVVASILLLIALYIFSPAIAFIPKVVISSILTVILIQIIDPWVVGLFIKMFSKKNLLQTEYLENILSILLVIFITLKFGLVAAVGSGIAVSICMFVFKMARSPVRLVLNGSVLRSNRMRDEASLQFLKENGSRIIIVQLDGVLFFGSADKIQNTLNELAQAKPECIIIDMTRVNTIDSTGANILMQIFFKLKKNDISLIFANLKKNTKSHSILTDLDFFSNVGKNQSFPDLDRALEAAENMILNSMEHPIPLGKVYQLKDFSMFKKMDDKELSYIESFFTQKKCIKGMTLFERGDKSDGLYLVSSGRLEVHIDSPEDGRKIRLNTMDAGSFFGEMTLVESVPRSASVSCIESGVVLRLDQDGFQEISACRPELAIHILSSMVRILSDRLRSADDKIRNLNR